VCEREVVPVSVANRVDPLRATRHMPSATKTGRKEKREAAEKATSLPKSWISGLGSCSDRRADDEAGMDMDSFPPFAAAD
jgi:hypothetical protein